MNIAEQVIQLKKDFDEVKEVGKWEGFASGYDEGYSMGNADGYSEGYDEGFEAGKSEGGDTEAAYQKGVTDGKKAEYDAFWDAYQNGGSRVDYMHGFGGAGWTTQTFRPKYDIRPTSAYMMFRYSGIEGDLVGILDRLGIVLDLSRCTNMQYLFTGCKFTRIGVIDLTSCPTACDGLFMAAAFLKEIDLIRVTEDNEDIGGAFASTTNLEKVTFEGTIGNSISFKNSAKLTTASVQSIIDHLKDLTGQTAQTLTFHATVGSKLTDEQKTTISTKNWTLVY